MLWNSVSIIVCCVSVVICTYIIYIYIYIGLPWLTFKYNKFAYLLKGKNNPFLAQEVNMVRPEVSIGEWDADHDMHLFIPINIHID